MQLYSPRIGGRIGPETGQADILDPNAMSKELEKVGSEAQTGFETEAFEADDALIYVAAGPRMLSMALRRRARTP